MHEDENQVLSSYTFKLVFSEIISITKFYFSLRLQNDFNIFYKIIPYDFYK